MGKFTPAVFIGVGGVGKNILLRIRRMIVENHKKLDYLPSIRFLHVDTDVNPGPDAGSSIPLEVMGQDLRFQDSERCDLSQRIMQEIAQGKDAIKDNASVKEWFDDTLQLDLNFKEGAGGIRPYGRLAFHYSVNDFRQKVRNAVSAEVGVTTPSHLTKTAEALGMSVDNNLNIYIVCSLLGGTGSGCFLEVCYNALVEAKVGITPYIIGVFVIGGNVDAHRKANCYSALMELEYHATAFLKGEKQHFSANYPLPLATAVSESGAPVNLCYLVSNLGEGGYVLGRNEMEEAIALNLYMEFGSVISNEKRSRRTDFTSIPEFQQLDEELGRSRQFLSFGISTLEFPAPRMQDMMAHELASSVLNGWLFEERRESPDLSRELGEIAALIEEGSLTMDLLTSDNINHLQKVSSKLSEEEAKVRDLINSQNIDVDLILTTVDNHITTSIESSSFSMDPRLCGEYARAIVNKAYDKQKELTRVIIQTVNHLVENEYRGPRQAKDYLNHLYRLLMDRIHTFEGKRNTFQNAAKKAQEPIYLGLRKLRETIGKDKFAMNHHNKKIHVEFLTSYMVLSLKREAYRAAYEILKVDRSERGLTIPSLLSLVESLDRQLGEYTQAIGLVSQDLDAKRQEIEATIIGTPIAEGIKLTPSRLKEIGKSIVPNPSSHILPLLNFIKNSLSEKDKDGNIRKQSFILELMLARKDEVESLLIEKCGEICEGIRNISVASELKDRPNLKDILTHKIRFSKPMIQGAGFKSGEDVRLNWLATAEPKGDLKGICDTINTIYQYRGSMKDRHLENLPDPYRIIFASEKGIFPIRRITMLSEYRKDYRMIKPKHTDVRIKYHDILPSIEENRIRERSEYSAFLGRFFNFLSQRKDPTSGYDHIYLSYFDDASRTTEHRKISETWESLEEILTTHQVEKEVDKKRTGPTYLEKLEELIHKAGSQAKTKMEREELWVRFQSFLAQLKEEIEGGDMNPEYQRQRNLVQIFRERYALKPPEGYMEAVSMPPEVGSKEPVGPRPIPENATKKYIQVLGEHFKKGIMEKEKMVNYAIRFLKFDKQTASQLFDAEISNYRNMGMDLEQRLKAYKDYFNSVIMDNEITEEERKTLREIQQKLGLTNGEVKEIEKNFTESLYLELFQLALMDNIISREERENLRIIQRNLDLTNEQVMEIESNFAFKEE